MDGIALVPFTVYDWRTPKDKRAFVFEGVDKEASGLEGTGDSAHTRVANTIYSTDTVETIRYKIAHHCSESKKEMPVHMWIESVFSREDRLLFAQNVFKNEVKLEKKYLNTVCKAYLGKNVYPGADADDFEVQDGFVNALGNTGGTRMYRNLNFRFTDRNDYEVLVSPQPFVVLDERSSSIGAVSAKTRFDKSILSKFSLNKPVVHCIFETARAQVASTVYFETPTQFDSEMDRYIRIKGGVQKDFSDPSDVVKDIRSKIDVFFFRVVPLSHNLELNLKTIFKATTTSYEMPIVVYKSQFNNEYKVNKLALVDMSKRQLDLFHEKERKQGSGMTFSRMNEVIIYYLRMSPSTFFYLLLSANGSYRVKYKSSKSNPLDIRTIQESFDKLGPIYNMLDNPSIFRIDEDTDLFNSSLVEVIEYNTQSSVHLTRPIDESRFTKNMDSGAPFFADMRKEARRKYVMQYIGTNNFFNTDTISAFIYKNHELNRAALVDKLKAYFQISEKDAQEVYEEKRNNIQLKISRKGRNIFAVRTHHTAVYVRIHISNDHVVKVYTSNTQDAAYHATVMYLLVQFLTRTIKPRKDLNKAMNDYATQSPKQQEDSYESNIQFNDLVADQNDDENDDEFDFDDIDIDFGSPNVNIELDMDDYDVNLNDLDGNVGDGDNAPSEHNFGYQHASDIEKEEDERQKSSALKKPNVENTNITNNGKTNEYTVFVLGELYKADTSLFRWPDAETKLKNYSSKCGATNYRQPVVINEEEKRNIDKTHSGSYTGYVQTGSTEELKQSNYYICPRIWCPVSRVSITQETYTKHGNRCPPPHKEKALFFPKEGTNAEKNYFMKSDGTESHYPSLMNLNLHPHGLPLPCCGKKATTSTQFNTEAPNEPTRPASEDRKKKTNYISNIASDMLLNAGQYGNLPHLLNKLLNGRAACNGPINSKTVCYVRTGVENTPNSLMDAIGACLDVEHTGKHMAQSLDQSQFVFLNDGNTLKTYVDNERQFMLEDKKEYALFKEHMKQNKTYVDRFGLKEEYKYVIEHDALALADREGLKADTLKMSIVREYLIYLSFMNFKRYLTSDDTPKSLRDIQHLLTLDTVNKNMLNFIFLEIVGDDVFLLNPVYFEYRAVLNEDQPSVLVLKIGDNFEYVRHISQNADNGPVISDKALLRPIFASLPALRDVSEEERKLYDEGAAKIRSYVLSTAIKCVGVLHKDDKELVRLSDPIALRYHKVDADKTFVFEDKLSVAEGLESASQDLELFVASLADTQAESVASEQKYQEALYKAAKVMLFTKKLRDAFGVINHDISNFSAKERAFLLDKIMRENKVQIPEGVNRNQIVHDLLHVPLQQIIDDHQSASKRMQDDELVLTIIDIMNNALYDYREQINRNPYKLQATSAEDTIDFVDHVKIDPGAGDASKQGVSPSSSATESDAEGGPENLFMSSERAELKPKKIQKLFSDFEAVNEPVDFAKAIDIFHRVNGDFTMQVFLDAYTAKVVRMYNADKDGLIKEFATNPSSVIQKIGKRSDINDFVNLINRANYHYSLFELRVMSEAAKVNLLVVGRDTKLAPDGIRFVNNSATEFVILTYAIHPTHQTFYLVTQKKGPPTESRVAFAQTAFSANVNKLLKSIR